MIVTGSWVGAITMQKEIISTDFKAVILLEFSSEIFTVRTKKKKNQREKSHFKDFSIIKNN